MAVKQLKPGTIFSYLVSFVIALFIFLAIESLCHLFVWQKLTCPPYFQLMLYLL